MSSGPGREIELKLFGAPDELARLGGWAATRWRLLSPPATTRVRTVYYDTPKLELAAAGVSVRLRQDGERRLLTLKACADETAMDQAGAAVWREWETPLTGDDFDPAIIDQFDGASLAPPELRAALDARFTTIVDRRRLLLTPADGVTVEMSIDHGEAVAAGKTLPISEIELELRQGPVTALFAMALELHARAALRLGDESKAEMGLRLLTGRAPRAVPPAPLGLSRLLTSGEAQRHGLRAAIACLNANLPAARHYARNSAGDSPAAAVVQMLAGLDRLRGALRPLSTLPPSDETRAILADRRWLKARLSPAALWTALTDRLIAENAPRKLSAAAADMSRDALTAAVRSLHAPRFTAWLLTLALRVEDERQSVFMPQTVQETPAATLNGAQLDYLNQRCDRSMRRLAKGEAAAATLRRRLRRLLDCADAGRGLYPPAAAGEYIDQFAPLMESLARWRAATVNQRLLAGLALEHPAQQSAAARWAKLFHREEKQALQTARRLCRTTPVPPAYWRDYANPPKD